MLGEGKLDMAFKLGLSEAGFAEALALGPEGIARPKSGVFVLATSFSETALSGVGLRIASDGSVGRAGKVDAFSDGEVVLVSLAILSELMMGGNGGSGGKSEVSSDGMFGPLATLLPLASVEVGNAGGVAPNAGSVGIAAGALNPDVGLL